MLIVTYIKIFRRFCWHYFVLWWERIIICKSYYFSLISPSKYSVSKKIPIAFHDGSNYHYHFIINELPEEFETQIVCLGENTEIQITFTVPIEKKLQELIKMEKKLKEIYFTDYNLLIAKDLWQDYCEV